ncbi:MAG TPA: hydrogenase/urease maturation nickel metallochaperone HypA [Actinomycetota bacterium]|nr:hydrogenase/urease maturation nickel metallochaperone HypA [Actinomycetota bacterium]
MHDYHAVHVLVERLTDELARDDGAVAEVRIRAGVAFSPEALVQAFEMLTPGTALEGSRLLVEGSTEETTCSACGHRWEATGDDLAGHWLVCPSCGALSEPEAGAGLEVRTVVRSPDGGGEPPAGGEGSRGARSGGG